MSRTESLSRRLMSRAQIAVWTIASLSAAAMLSAGMPGESRVAQSTSPQLPMWLQRGQPNDGHIILKALAGDWRVDKSIYIAMGTRERPARSREIVARRRLIAGGRYLHDVTEGPFAGSTYYRMGLLGYSTMDRRYEFVTVDGTNANMMIYRGEPLPADRLTSRPLVISMKGTFTDQGLIGEETAGRSVAMRTVITLDDSERHVIDLYFTPPGKPEMLIDRSVYTRLTN
jgi:Protein of unknown function (DUF1579)